MTWLNRCRAAAIVIVVVATSLMMWIGKQHLLVLENTPCEVEGTTLAPFDTVIVRISEKDELEIYGDESDYIEPVGPYCTLEIEIPGERGKPGRFLSKRLYLGFSDRITINIPKLVREETR
jgi:hypothetical protein